MSARRILRVTQERWPFATPFVITGHVFEAVEVVVVEIEEDGCIGRAEAAGVYYRGEDMDALCGRLERNRAAVESGIAREELQAILPPGGARNAVDCALWDLEAKLQTRPVWQLAGLKEPRPLTTTITIGAADPDLMARQAGGLMDARAIKLKLIGDGLDSLRVRAVREARPDAWLGIDANQGLSREGLDRLLPILDAMAVQMIEQPFPIDSDMWLDGLDSPIPIIADESFQSLDDLDRMIGRYDGVNIKLDKCGGLTEALMIARAATAAGLQVMVGNMLGTSLAMAPAALVGQSCEIVDLDGPILLVRDREPAARYHDGLVDVPPELWGAAHAE